MQKYITLNTPLALFTEPAYASLSNDACLLYGLFLDREDYSRKNGWLENERVYFIFTIDEIMTFFKCSKGKAVKLKQELEAVGLLEQVKGGFNKPTKLFLSAVQTEQMYDVDSKTSPKTEPYLTKTNTKKQDTIKDTKTNENKLNELDNSFTKDLSKLVNNGVSDMYLNDRSLDLIGMWVNTPADAYKFIGVINNAKKFIEKQVSEFILVDDYKDEIFETVKRVIYAYRTKKIKNKDNYLFGAFKNTFSNIFDMQQRLV